MDCMPFTISLLIIILYYNPLGIWHKPLLQNDGGLVVDWPIAHGQFFHIHHFPFVGTCCGPVGFPQPRFVPLSRHFSTKDTLTNKAIRRHGRGGAY
jgi:hypothetical protein